MAYFTIQYLAFAVFISMSIILFIIVSITNGYVIDFILALAAFLCCMLAFATKYYSYLILPLLKRKGRKIVINPNEPFQFSTQTNTIIVREGVNVYASAFVRIPIYKSATEMNKSEKLEFAKLFSMILGIGTGTVRISSQLYVVNKDEYIAKIRQKFEEAEEHYRTMLSDPSMEKGMSERIKGEVSMWYNLLTNVTGSQSQSLLAYAMVSELGYNEEEASTIVMQRAEEISAGISSLLGINTSIATKEEMLALIEPDYMIPVETVNERIRQKNIKEGL